MKTIYTVKSPHKRALWLICPAFTATGHIRRNTLTIRQLFTTAQNPNFRPVTTRHHHHRTMIIPRPLLRSPLLRSASLLCPCTIRPVIVSPILSFLRTKVTINQILRGSRVPPKKKRVKKPEAPDLKQSPFKKAVVQKVFIVKPKVRPPSLPPVPQTAVSNVSSRLAWEVCLFCLRSMCSRYLQ